MIIKLQVQHQSIQGVKQVPRLIIEDSRRFVYLDLEFDEEWDGLTKTVIFSNDRAGSNNVAITWTGEPIEVPAELLVDGTLRISCVGVGNNGLYLPTEYMAEGVRIYRAGEQTGFEPGASVPGLWEQVLATVGSLDALDTENKDNMVDAVNEIHGKSIKSIEQTVFSDEDGGINEFTITQTNGTKTVLQVRNGSTGAKGDKGEDGRGIKSIVSAEEGAWVVTYTDDTTQTIKNEAYWGIVALLGTATEEAVSAASSAGTSAEAAAQSAEEAELSAQAAARSETAAAGSAEAAALSEQNAKASEEAAAKSAEAAELSAQAAAASAEAAELSAQNAQESEEAAASSAEAAARSAEQAETVVNETLREAMESGAFDGKDGKDGEDGIDGPPGVVYSETEPTDPAHPVWIKPSGEPTGGGGVDFTTDETLTLDPVTKVLSVNTADVVEQDNTLPITSAAVFTTVGNISAILDTI